MFCHRIVYTDESLPGIPSKTSHIFLAKSQSTKLVFFSLAAIIYLLFFSKIHLLIQSCEMNERHGQVLHRLSFHHQ